MNYQETLYLLRKHELHANGLPPKNHSISAAAQTLISRKDKGISQPATTPRPQDLGVALREGDKDQARQAHTNHSATHLRRLGKGSFLPLSLSVTLPFLLFGHETQKPQTMMTSFRLGHQALLILFLFPFGKKTLPRLCLSFFYSPSILYRVIDSTCFRYKGNEPQEFSWGTLA